MLSKAQVKYGFIPARAYRLGVGPVPCASQVYEPAGFTGDKVTIVCPINRKWAITIPRNGLRVYATKKAAIKQAKKLFFKDN